MVVLDLDNTLYAYHPCHQKALQALVGAASVAFKKSEEEVKALYMQCRKVVNARHHGTAVSHSRLFYVQMMVEQVFNRTDTALVSKLYQLYWDTFINHMVLFPDAANFLNDCLLRNIIVVLATDMTTEVQFQKIKKLNIEKYLQFVVTSEEAGTEKPNPFLFELAIEKCKSVRSGLKNIIVIGDDRHKDVYQSDAYAVTCYLRTDPVLAKND